MFFLYAAIMLLSLAIAYILGRTAHIPQSLDKVKIADATNQTIISPQITVVFQQDIDDDDELYKEIADMYLENRVFYYSGTNPSPDIQLLPEKEIDVFVRFNNIDFSKLQRIEV